MTIEVPCGTKYYQSQNTGLQGSSGSDANFNLANNEFFYANQSDYIFPNLNFAVFERIFSNFLQLFYHPWFSI
jgi:Fe(3+) dicitrate transport protein